MSEFLDCADVDLACAARRIEELEAENAHLHHQTNKLAQQVLIAQHRIKVLREALEETVESFGLLSFHCDGIFSTKAPPREIYNQTYDVYRKQQATLATPDNTAEYDQLVKDAELGKAFKFMCGSAHRAPTQEAFAKQVLDATMKETGHAPD